ncbi:MAG: hypothetical protein WA738_05830 [Candidatus Angelobacter sp.]
MARKFRRLEEYNSAKLGPSLTNKGAPVSLVLCTGVNPVLMETRKLILQRAGHTVITAINERELDAACTTHGFDVAVIGQTVSSKMKKAIALLIRKQCPSAKIVELYPLYQSKVLEDADAWLEVPIDIPDELAQVVNELTRKTRFGQP